MLRLLEYRSRNHADIAQHVTVVNRVFDDPMIARFWNPGTAVGDVPRSMPSSHGKRRSQINAYIDDYKLLMIATLAVIPLLIVLKTSSRAGGADHAVVSE